MIFGTDHDGGRLRGPGGDAGRTEGFRRVLSRMGAREKAAERLVPTVNQRRTNSV